MTYHYYAGVSARYMLGIFICHTGIKSNNYSIFPRIYSEHIRVWKTLMLSWIALYLR